MRITFGILKVKHILGVTISAAYIPTGRGKKCLVLNGYSYIEGPATFWICSRRKNKKCMASARTNKKAEVISVKGEHNHEKPMFYQKTTNKRIHLSWIFWIFRSITLRAKLHYMTCFKSRSILNIVLLVLSPISTHFIANWQHPIRITMYERITVSVYSAKCHL